ncbi:MAG TPA: hypothetical protein VFS43_05795 [Polyangiaceae bacterium]|nr:hypothetical protein [Polyangiaceae bacterium]
MSRRALPGRRAALALLALVPAACSRPRPPPRPYGHLPLRPERLAPLPLATLPPLRAGRPLVVSRFDDASTQPVGAAYEGRGELPLRTYAFERAALELSEHFCDALRAAGLDARLAYAAAPAPGGDEGARVRGELLAFQHDVARAGRGPHEFVHAARALLRLEAGGAPSAKPFARTWSLEGKAPPDSDGADLLLRFGRWAAALAAGDAAFLAAVGAQKA